MENGIGVVLLKYFYFIVVIVNILNMLIMLTMQRTSKREFLQLFSLVFVSSFFVFGIMQLLGGYKTPFYIISDGFEIFKSIAWLYGIGIIGFLFYKNNFYFYETIEFHLSNRIVKIGDKNLAMNISLVLFIIVIGVVIKLNIYSGLMEIFS